MNEQQRAEAAYLELVYGDDVAARDIAREPIDPPVGCDMPCACESVEYACEHEWEYCAVVGRGTDYICQKCGIYRSEHPTAGGKLVYPGPNDFPVVLTGPGGDYLHAETPEGAVIVTALMIGVALSVVLGVALAWAVWA